jgi:hypothetical protein
MEDDLIFSKMENNLIFFKENDHIFRNATKGN